MYASRPMITLTFLIGILVTIQTAEVQKSDYNSTSNTTMETDDKEEIRLTGVESQNHTTRRSANNITSILEVMKIELEKFKKKSADKEKRWTQEKQNLQTDLYNTRQKCQHDLEAVNDDYSDVTEVCNQQISFLKNTIGKMQESCKNESEILTAVNKERTEELKNKEKELENVKKELENKEKALSNIQQDLKNKEKALAHVQQEFVNKEKALGNVQQEFVNKAKELGNVQQELKNNKEVLENVQEKLKNNEEKCATEKQSLNKILYDVQNRLEGEKNYWISVHGYCDKNLQKVESELLHCQREKLAYNSHTYGGSSYKLYTEPKTWNEAVAACKKYGAHLVVPERFDEAQYIFQNVVTVNDPVWIGVYSDNWQWSSIRGQSFNTAASFFGGSTVPSRGEECAALRIVDDAFDLSGHKKDNVRLPYVCERP